MRHDSTRDNSSVAICDMHDKTMIADLTHDNLHCDTLTDAERQNIRSLSSLNSAPTQKTQGRICAQRTPPDQKAGRPGAKRARTKAVKKMQQHSTEYKLSSEDATAFRALSARAK